MKLTIKQLQLVEDSLRRAVQDNEEILRQHQEQGGSKYPAVQRADANLRNRTARIQSLQTRIRAYLKLTAKETIS